MNVGAINGWHGPSVLVPPAIQHPHFQVGGIYIGQPLHFQHQLNTVYINPPVYHPQYYPTNNSDLFLTVQPIHPTHFTSSSSQFLNASNTCSSSQNSSNYAGSDKHVAKLFATLPEKNYCTKCKTLVDTQEIKNHIADPLYRKCPNCRLLPTPSY